MSIARPDLNRSSAGFVPAVLDGKYETALDRFELNPCELEPTFCIEL